MVSFLPLDVSDEDSIDTVLSTIDTAIQYGEDVEPREPRDPDDDREEASERAAFEAYTANDGQADHKT
jgi:hypothetical protein